jgi:hypothetical protein
MHTRARPVHITFLGLFYGRAFTVSLNWTRLYYTGSPLERAEPANLVDRWAGSRTELQLHLLQLHLNLEKHCQWMTGPLSLQLTGRRNGRTEVHVHDVTIRYDGLHGRVTGYMYEGERNPMEHCATQAAARLLHCFPEAGHIEGSCGLRTNFDSESVEPS